MRKKVILYLNNQCILSGYTTDDTDKFIENFKKGMKKDSKLRKCAIHQIYKGNDLITISVFGG